MIKNLYYYIIISLILFYNCEDAPIETQLDSGGHELFTYSNNNAVFKTIQLSNKIGNSSNLYIGRVNNKQSFALIKLNSDVFSNNETICNNLKDID